MPHIRNRRWVYFPMETLAREVSSRVLLALELAERGYAVVLGPRRLAHLAGATLPPGIILFKALVDMGEQFGAAKEKGNTITAVCEEGLVYPSGEAYVHRRIDPDAWKEASRFYAWGNRQAQDIKAFMGDDRNIIRITGNPRFDVLRQGRLQAQACHRQNRKYVLINSNFGFVNPLAKREKMPHAAASDMKHPDVWVRYQSESSELFPIFVELAKRLGQSREIPVVLRPHPGENGRFWEDLCQGFPNVKVTMRNAAADWIAGAAAVLHNNCTTAVESFVLGVPPVSLGIQERAGMPSLPNSLSIPAEDPNHAIRIIKDILKAPERGKCVFNEANREMLEFYLWNYREGQYAYRSIADDMETLPADKHSFAPSYHDHFLESVRSWRSRRRVLQSGTTSFPLQKFPGLDGPTMKNAIKEAKALLDKPDRFRLMCVAKDIWLIYACW